jgi:prepilin-type N-terminal cleavage/methylation domain-containing protein
MANQNTTRSFKMRFRLLTQSGFSLIEVLMATAILAILSVGMIQLFESQYKQVKSIGTLSNNTQLGLRIARYAGMSSALTVTANAAPNSNFTRCVLGTGTGSCVDSGVSLRDPAGTVITGDSAGTPIRYDLNGVVCAAVGPTCPFEAITTFTRSVANCGALPCFITISYSVTQVTDVPNTPRMRPNQGTVTVQIPLTTTWNGTGNRMALWSTSTDLIAGNIVQGTGANAGQIQINRDGTYAGAGEALSVNGRVLMADAGLAAGTGCAGITAGTLRNANGSLEVCDGTNWHWAAGRLDSGATTQAYTSGLGSVPTVRMPGVYVCPSLAGGSVSKCDVCGRAPVCMGQMQTGKDCWTCAASPNFSGLTVCNSATRNDCTPLF